MVRQRRSESIDDQRGGGGIDSREDGYRRMTIKSRLGPKGEPIGQRSVTLQELSKRVLVMAWRYGHNISSDDESDNPFIDQIAYTQFPERFRMPTIEQYKENKDPKEHVRRFYNVMAHKAFVRQFMGSVQRIKSFAHLSNLKQESNESLKKYLTRFRKEVAQIEDASDVAVIVAFTNGCKAIDCPLTYGDID
ncbi:hypothetical protein Q3G72_010378 [Acer saccharum]|nr:hypothetical protein Q3G72_010378 [Acer saccharum]